LIGKRAQRSSFIYDKRTPGQTDPLAEVKFVAEYLNRVSEKPYD